MRRIARKNDQLPRHLAIGNAIFEAINQGSSLDVVLGLALDHMLGLFHADAGRIYLCDEKGQALHLAAQRQWVEVGARHASPLLDSNSPLKVSPSALSRSDAAAADENITLQALRKDRPAARARPAPSLDSRQALERSEGPDRAVSVALPSTIHHPSSAVRTVVTAPLMSQGQILGVIELARYPATQAQAFTTEEGSLLQGIAQILGTMAAHARIIERARAAERQATFLAEVSRLFQSSHDITQTLELCLARCSETLGEWNLIFLREGMQLHLAAIHGPDPAIVEQLRALAAEQPVRLGESAVGRAVLTGETICLSGLPLEQLGELVAPAYRAGAALLAGSGSQHVESFLAAPLKVADRAIGALSSFSLSPKRHLGPDEVELAQMIAERAAAAIENAHLYQELHRRLHMQTVLVEASDAFASARSVDDVFGMLSGRLTTALNATGVAISQWDPHGGRLATTNVYPISLEGPRPFEGETGRLQSRLSDYITIHQLSERQAIRTIDGLASDAAYAEAYESALLAEFGAQALLIAPLSVKGELLGFIEVYESRAQREFSAEEIALAQALVRQAAVAIENVRLLESLRATHDELEESNRLKDEFIQNVSHELRTPLTFVKGYIELMREGAFGPMSEEGQRALSIVTQKTNQIIRLVERIATLHFITRQQLSLEELDLNVLAREAADRFRSPAGQASITLNTDLPDTPVQVTGDRAQLAQVFDCLLENAIKFSPEGSEVALRLYARPGIAWVEVEDHGIGIPQDKLDKVWSPFYQVEGHMRRRFGGAGVGLAVVRRVVQAHGGHVWASSQPGRGCTFGFALRCTKEQQ